MPFFAERDPDRAREELQEERKVSPRRADVCVQLAILEIKAGRPQKAAKLANEAHSLGGDTPLAHLVLGRAFLDMKRYRDAIPEFETASRMDPDNAQAHLYLARAFRHKGLEEKAKKEQSEFTRLKTSKSLATGS
jgi:predicted Zn-dependent protease